MIQPKKTHSFSQNICIENVPAERYAGTKSISWLFKKKSLYKVWKVQSVLHTYQV